MGRGVGGPPLIHTLTIKNEVHHPSHLVCGGSILGLPSRGKAKRPLSFTISQGEKEALFKIHKIKDRLPLLV